MIHWGGGGGSAVQATLASSQMYFFYHFEAFPYWKLLKMKKNKTTLANRLDVMYFFMHFYIFSQEMLQHDLHVAKNCQNITFHPGCQNMDQVGVQDFSSGGGHPVLQGLEGGYQPVGQGKVV